MSKKQLSILGSTGSIGIQTLEIVSEFSDQFSIFGLGAGTNIDLLKQQMIAYRPKMVSVVNEPDAVLLQSFIKEKRLPCDVVFGPQGAIQVATASENELLVMAIVGTSALAPTYAAILKSIPIALASKEVLVAAGQKIMQLALKNKVPIIPIDSEHAALKQCLSGIKEDQKQIERLILTASGGPFWQRPKDQFKAITKVQALRHPNWSMGQKITIDSASLMNKGLEIIEAHHLYQIPFNQIEAVIHPQSIVHGIAEFTDGTMLAQMSLPDMRFPIQYALTYPKKLENPWPKVSLSEIATLSFYEPDMTKFPLLKLAYDVGEKGGTYPVVMNAANEAAVQLFLDEKIHFLEIEKTIETALAQFNHYQSPSIEDIIEIDQMIKASVLS